jgi:hypothetical protein
MSEKAKPPTIPLAQGSRLRTSKTSDRLESNYTTPNGAIYKTSSSPYFKVYSLFILFNMFYFAQVILCISMNTYADYRQILNGIYFFPSFL